MPLCCRSPARGKAQDEGAGAQISSGTKRARGEEEEKEEVVAVEASRIPLNHLQLNLFWMSRRTAAADNDDRHSLVITLTAF